MIIVSNADSTDRGITSTGVNYNSVLNGNMRDLTNDTYALLGQLHQTGNNQYYIRQYFSEFQYTLPSSQIPVSGHFYARHSNAYGTNRTRNLEIREYDWGVTLDTNDWRTPSQLSSLPLTAVSFESNRASANTSLFMGLRTVYDSVGLSGVKRYVWFSSRNRNQNVPPDGSREDNNISTSTSSAAPRLVVGTTTQNMLHPVLAAQVQLTDGSWIMLEKTGMDRAAFNVVLRHVRSDGSDHIIWDSSLSFDLSTSDRVRGSHAFALARDESDNLFLCDPSYESDGVLNLRVFTRSFGDTWVPGANRVITLPTDDTSSNVQSVQMTYHDTGGGRLMIVAFRDWGVIGGTQETFNLVSVPALMTGSGSLTLQQGRGGERGFTAYPANAGRWNPLNPTGTLFDMHADTYHERTGYIVSAERHAPMGSVASMSVGRYRIHSNNNQVTSETFSWLDLSGGFSVYDPDAKARVLSLGQQNLFAKITVDPRVEYGLTVDTFSVSFGATESSKLSSVRFDAPGVAVDTMPEGSVLASKMTWDAIYFPPDNSVWVYYLDKDNPRRLMRTAIRMGTYQAQQNEVEVAAELAPSGHEIHALRVQRNKVTGDQILITAASEDGSGNHHYQYHIDRINVPPTQPIPNQVANYDAENSRDFSWTFRDANFNDTQSAYELEIVTASDSTPVVSTGKVTSSNSVHTVAGETIPNNDSYIWRVRVWDSADEVSVWSNYSTFDTSNTGVVEIIDPSMDNDPDIFTESYLVKWDVVGASQDQYRVIVTRTQNNSVFLDTNWIDSGVQEHLVLSLESDVEYLITVRARASLVESAPGYRLLTTHFVTVEQPVVTLQVQTEFLLVSVENPEPRGDRPHPTINRIYRRQLGTDGPFQYVGSCEPNSTFRDYTVASSTVYEYKVRSGVEE